jgi:nucleoporin NUP42
LRRTNKSKEEAALSDAFTFSNTFKMSYRKECTFYKQGLCRNGNSCKFAHTEATSTIGNDLINMTEVKEELGALRPIWKYSCYALVRGGINVIKDTDYSMDEARLECMDEQKRTGNITGYLNKIGTLTEQIDISINEIMRNPEAALQKVKSGQPLIAKITSTFGAKPSAFGGSSFGAAQAQSAFGPSSFSTPVKSTFGSSIAPAQSAFGASIAPAQSAFGASVTPVKSAFGANTTPIKSVFGTTSVQNSFSALANTNTTQAPAFGSSGFGSATPENGFGSTGFGNSAPSTSAFGTTGFGATTSAFGSTGFGSAPAARTSAFGNAFGSSVQANPATSAFGASAFGTTSTPATNAFGSTPSPATNVFGSTPTPATNVFGSTPTPATNVFGSTPTPATNVFGSTPTPTTNVFGSTPTPATNVFGSTPTPVANVFGTAPVASVFGNTPSPFGASSTSAFGKPTPATNAFGSSSISAFGTTPTPATTPRVTTAFDLNSNIANTRAPNLTDSEIEKAFRSEKFEFGKIPELPPPQVA